MFHLAASSGVVFYPETQFDMVRVGIGLFGVWPSDEIGVIAETQKGMRIKPVLSWKTLISEVKSVAKGESIGYDFTETLARDSVVAVCPIGYWHGYSRELSSIGELLVKGVRSRVLGRVSMSMICIDVTDIVVGPEAKGAVKVGEEVVVIGQQGDAMVTGVATAAQIPGSSRYELLTRLNPLIKRIYF
jgi:alanine racemase